MANDKKAKLIKKAGQPAPKPTTAPAKTKWVEPKAPPRGKAPVYKPWDDLFKK